MSVSLHCHRGCGIIVDRFSNGFLYKWPLIFKIWPDLVILQIFDQIREGFKMKKSLFAAALMSLFLAACGNNADKAQEAASAASEAVVEAASAASEAATEASAAATEAASDAQQAVAEGAADASAAVAEADAAASAAQAATAAASAAK